MVRLLCLWADTIPIHPLIKGTSSGVLPRSLLRRDGWGGGEGHSAKALLAVSAFYQLDAAEIVFATTLLRVKQPAVLLHSSLAGTPPIIRPHPTPTNPHLRQRPGAVPLHKRLAHVPAGLEEHGLKGVHGQPGVGAMAGGVHVVVAAPVTLVVPVHLRGCGVRGWVVKGGGQAWGEVWW